MERKEVYRITTGILNSKELEFQIKFGLVFEENGMFYVDLYIDGDSSFKVLAENPIFRQKINVVCTTEDDNHLEIKGLHISYLNPHNMKIKLTCHDCLIHTKKKDWDDQIQKPIGSTPIYYLEIEGLNIEFSEFTQSKVIRGTQEVKKLMDRNHSTALLVIDQMMYNNQTFSINSETGNIIVEFDNEESNKLTYDKFFEIKEDYISFLSFLNGATAKIKKVYTGNYVTMGMYSHTYSSEIIIIHSFEEINNKSYNDYIPLGERRQNVPENILSLGFLFSFNKFREWNKKIDLRSIIYYLNTSQKINSAEEKFFIEIIAFERLTTLYAINQGHVDERLPDANDFVNIKQEFFDLLDTHKAKFGANYGKAKGILGNLNQVKRLSTNDKMFGILDDLKIIPDDDIRELINIVRNDAVHEGRIGEGLDAIKNMYLLNELLYEIILRLIDYRGPRCNQYLLERNLTAPTTV